MINKRRRGDGRGGREGTYQQCPIDLALRVVRRRIRRGRSSQILLVRCRIELRWFDERVGLGVGWVAY